MPMKIVEQTRLNEIEVRLKILNHSYDSLFKIFNNVERSMKSLKSEVEALEWEHTAITQGQLVFKDSLNL